MAARTITSIRCASASACGSSHLHRRPSCRVSHLAPAPTECDKVVAMRRTLFALTIVITAGFALLRAQTPVVAPTTPPRGVLARPQDRAPSAPAMASVDPALFKGLKYRLVGPSRGG